MNANHFNNYFSNLAFPFAAIALLFDNALLVRSKSCNILFGVNNLGKENTPEGNKYIIVEDNGSPNLIWNKEINSDTFFEISNTIYTTGLV